MTYADTITLLLCLFMVLLSLSAAKRHPAQIACAVPVARTPFDPFGGRLPFPAAREISGSTDDAHSEIDDDDGRGAVAVRVVAPPPVGSAPARPSALAVRAADAVPLTGKPARLPATLAKLSAQHKANVEQQGSRLTTVQMSSAAFFDSGSAVISQSGNAILRDVTASLVSPRFANYRITVEGHTDDTPISSSQFPSNWELSTARASAVVHFFLDQGIDPQRLRAAGYADTFPVAPNRDADGRPIPENQAKNRRVVIRLERIEDHE